MNQDNNSNNFNGMGNGFNNQMPNPNDGLGNQAMQNNNGFNSQNNGVNNFQGNNQNNQQVTTEEQQQFLNSFKEAGNKYKNFSGVDLEDRDLTSTYDYAFKPTLNGASKLAMDLNNPEKLFKMAFFMAHGDELLQNLHTAYMSELSKKDKEIPIKTLMKMGLVNKVKKTSLTILPILTDSCVLS